jgi:hypothetical protein
MNWRSILLAVVLGLSLSAAHADISSLNETFAGHDRLVEHTETHWQTAYRQAVNLAKSPVPQQALPVFESLLSALAEQDHAFSRVYVRYYTLADALSQRPRTLVFLQDLATQHPTPRVLGALNETRLRVSSLQRSQALAERLSAQANQAALATDLYTLTG